MKAILLGIFLFAASIAPASADNAAIRSVIQSQLDAFRADDVTTAYGFAAPSIQRMFPTPEIFGQMVERGYPMVWRPSGIRFGPVEIRRGRPVQTVFLTDSTGRSFAAEYEMTETAEGWRISGVWVRTVDLGA